MSVMMTKRCRRCQEEKVATMFRRNHRNRDGLQSYCRECSNRVSSEWQRQNIDRYRDAQLKWKYGISKADYNQLLVEQNGLCQVCRKPRSEKRALAVDHCHATGAIRGLLCDRCNHLLGHARDSVEILRSAIEYLEQHNKRRLEETQ